MNKLEPLKKKSEPAIGPLNSFEDERGEDTWNERDLAKLKRPGHGSDRNQASTSGHPNEGEK